MSCPAPKSQKRAKRPAAQAPADGLPSAFTLHFRRRRGKAGGWLVSSRSVAASGVDAEAAFRDALAGLAASRKGGAR